MTPLNLDNTQVYKTALEALEKGISVVPPSQDGSKRPSQQWSKYMERLATLDELDKWYVKNQFTGVGFVLGKISKNLEFFDFDDRSAFAEFKRLCEEAEVMPILDKIINGYCEYSPNGAHIPFYCCAVEGSQKLAKTKDNKVLIETRGEGGYIIVAPTFGGVNQSGSYVMQSGGISTIATITPEERKQLFDVARMLDESIKPEQVEVFKANVAGRPGDDFNEKAEWDDVLKGWNKVCTRLGVTSWRRPGKKIGISATTNHNGSDLLYVFSTSTPFEANRGYSKFSAYAILHHGGDFKAATRELSLQGYGVESPYSSGVDISELLINIGAVKDISRHTHSKIEDLLAVPGLVGDLASWIVKSSPKQQPILALGASIASMSTILGRKVQLKNGLRPNIYVLGVGETGCGKERARQCIKMVYDALGQQGMVIEGVSSGSALETVLKDNPVVCLLIDEIGYFLSLAKEDSASGYVKEIVPMLLKLYTAGETSYRCLKYADKERNSDVIVEQPSFSLYGTTVPSVLYSGISKRNLSDGFLSRLLVFESEDPDPIFNFIEPEDRNIPKNVVDGYNYWINKTNNPYASGNVEELTPNPLIVQITSEALKVFYDLESMMRQKRAAMRKLGEDQGPYTRVHATAMKLAMIRACGVVFDNPEITEMDAKWGCDLAWLLTDMFLKKIENRVSENKIESYSQRIYEIIGSCKEGITKRELSRRSQWVRRQERCEIINTLLESGLIFSDGKDPTVYKDYRHLKKEN